MGRFLIFLTAAVGILSLTCISQAQEKHGRFFAGGGFSYAGEQFDDGDLKDFPGNSSIDNSWGFNIFGGYWWHRHLAVEGNFNWYADFEGRAASGIDFDISIWTAMLDLKVFSPPLWQDRVFPYLKVGGGYMDVEIDARTVNSDEGDWAYNIGLGFDAFVTHDLSVGLDGKRVWGTGEASDFNHLAVTVRAAYHF